MAIRPGWLGLWLICLGCQSLPPLGQEKDDAGTRWEMGQAAMREGHTEEAIRCYESSLTADPNFTRNHLSLAAAYLEQNDSDSARAHLAQYVAANRDQLPMRHCYAELLFQLHRLPEARTQFEALVCDSQASTSPAPDLINCHGRLLSIALESRDGYNEHLHRGIGLFLLACKCGGMPEVDEAPSVEGLLFKAAGELTRAHLQRPDEARPCWYLYEVWSRLGQRQPALCRLREADAAAPFTFLTPAERCSLCLAQERYSAEVQHK
jgi:tetratricopeptide (TPR) repeat protein